jgi:hypothetical protein
MPCGLPVLAAMAERRDLLQVVDDAVGVYGTAPTCYLSALARLPDFTIEEFDEAIGQAELVRIRAMRYAAHTFSSQLLPVAAAATRTLARKTDTYRRQIGGDYDRLAAEIEQAVAAKPLAGSDIRTLVDPERELGELFNLLLGMMAAEFRIVRTNTTGSWRSDRYLYARWKDWFSETDPSEIDEAAARRELVRRYVAAYGPVDVGDVKWWTGWTKAETLEAVDGIDLAAEGDAVAALDGVRLLPVWDTATVAYHNRTGLYDPGYSPLIYDRFGNATSVVLDSGSVVGQWDLGSNDDPLVIKLRPTVCGVRSQKTAWTNAVEARPVDLRLSAAMSMSRNQHCSAERRS